MSDYIFEEYNEAIGHCHKPDFEIRKNVLDLKIYQHEISEDDIENFKNLPFEIRVADFGEIMSLLFQVGNLTWQNAEYNIVQSQQEPDVNSKVYLFNAHLYETSTGRLCADRIERFSEKSGEHIRRMLKYQKQFPVSRKQYEFGAKMIERSNDMESLWKRACMKLVLL